MQTMENMIYKERKFSLTLDTEQLNKPHTQKFQQGAQKGIFSASCPLLQNTAEWMSWNREPNVC